MLLSKSLFRTFGEMRLKIIITKKIIEKSYDGSDNSAFSRRIGNVIHRELPKENTDCDIIIKNIKELRTTPIPIREVLFNDLELLLNMPMPDRNWKRFHKP